MAGTNGSGNERYDSFEDAIRSLIEHGEQTDKRFHETDKRLNSLAEAIMKTNENVIHLSGHVEGLSITLLGGLRELINRIPPENLR